MIIINRKPPLLTIVIIVIFTIFIFFNNNNSLYIHASPIISNDNNNNNNNINNNKDVIVEEIIEKKHRVDGDSSSMIPDSFDDTSYSFSYSSADTSSSSSSSGHNHIDCVPPDPSQYAVLVGGDLEKNSFRYGFNQKNSNVLIHYHDIMTMSVVENIPYQGEYFAMFQNTSSTLESLPILFPNFIGNTTNPPDNDPYTRLYLNLFFRVLYNGDNATSPDNNPYISIALNGQEIDRITTNSTSPSPSKPSDTDYQQYQYHQYRLNVTQYANGTYYTLTFKYVDPTTNTTSTTNSNDSINNINNTDIDDNYGCCGSSSSGDQPLVTMYLIDYITFISQPNTLISNDIYISSNGSDRVGNGTLINPYCSLSRAIDMIESGYTIYLMSNMTYSYHLENATFGFDTQGKNLTFTSYIEPSKNASLKYNWNYIVWEPLSLEVIFMMVSSPSVMFSKIKVYTPSVITNEGYGLLWTIGSGSNFTMINVMQQGSIINLQPSTALVLSSGAFTSITSLNSSFDANLGTPLFSLRGDNNNFINNVFINNVGFVFALASDSANLLVDSSLLVGTSGLSVSDAFNNVTISNTIFSKSISDIGASYFTFGENVTFYNNRYYGSIISFNISYAQNVNVTGCIFDGVVALDNSVIRANFISGTVTIQDTIVSNTPSTTDTFFYLESVFMYQAYLHNLTFENNGGPILEASNVYISAENITFFNQMGTVAAFTVTLCDLVANNITYVHGAPFLDSTSSTTSLTNSVFTENENMKNLELVLISIDYGILSPNLYEVSLIQNITFTYNGNFILIQISNNNGDLNNVLVDSITFTNNQMCDFIYIYNGKASITNTVVADNFLATFYPVRSIRGEFNLTNSYVSRTSQYFYISQSSFQINNVTWYNMNTADNSLLVQQSNGTFNQCKWLGSAPNLGFIVLDSNLLFTKSKFGELSGYDTPLGSFNNSNIVYNNCIFSNNTAGNNMMLHQYGNVTFSYCTFSNQSSPKTAAFTAIYCNVDIHNSEMFSMQGDHGVNLVLSTLTTRIFEFTFNMVNYLIVFNDVYATMESSIAISNLGGFYYEDSFVSITNFTFTDNFPPKYLMSGGGTYLEISSTYFSGNNNPTLTPSLFFFYSESDLLISNSTFINQDIIHANGSIFSMQNSGLTLEDTIFEQNSAAFGMIYLINTTTGINNCTFNYNRGYSGAGAIYASKGSTIDVSQSTFISNQAESQGMGVNDLNSNSQLVIGSGGCFILDHSTLNSFGSYYNGNDASKCGGVVYLQNNAIASFKNDSFLNNMAYYGAGAVCYSKFNMGCNFVGNGNFFDTNMATYGNIMATGPRYINLTFSDVDGANVTHLHPFTPFLATATLLDSYGQVVTVLPNPISINITLTNDVKEVWNIYQISETIQGIMQVNMMVNDSNVIGSLVSFNVNTSNGFSLSTDVPFKSCDPGYHPSSNTSLNCVACNPNTYGWDGATCISCTDGDLPTQVICPGGNEIVARQGWWIYPNSTPPDIYECDPDICLDGGCRPSQTGILCSVCEPGYRKVKLFCEECHSFNFILLAGMVIFVVLYIAMMTTFRIPSATVLLNFLFCLQGICVLIFDIRYVAIVPLFNFMVDYWPSTCFSPELTYLWKTVVSIGSMFLIMFCSVNFSWGKNIVWRFFPQLINLVSETFDKSLGYTIYSHLMTLYTPLAFISLSMVSCYRIGDEYYLTLDASVQCFTHFHYPLFIGSCLVILFVVIGMPLFIIFQIKRRSKYFNKVFFDKYKPRYRWWDIFLMLRSLCFIITSISVVYHTDLKSLVTSTLGLAFTCLNWFISPFKQRAYTELETQFGLILCLVSLMVNSRALNNSEILTGVLTSLMAIIPFIALFYCIRKITVKKVRLTDSLSNDWGIISSANSINYDKLLNNGK